MEEYIKQVKKYSGELIDFDIEKLRFSLSKSGASPIEIEEVLQSMTPHIHNGMTTKNLYKLAFRQLKRISGTFAARYSLKRALRDLGPAGYYFEKWTSRFLRSYGYVTDENQIIKGDAVSHEADVIALKDGKLFWIECKFRNTVDAKISVTTPMYLLSRVKDISDKTYTICGGSYQFDQGWLITNAYLTLDSIQFGEYYGIKMLSWDYPAKNSIKNLVDKMGLYPITCLTSITKREKDYLMQKDCILVKDILDNPEILDNNHVINQRNKNKILKEVNELIWSNPDEVEE